ncbi:MAG: hypothetical protein PHQ21_02335 [Firmicutes bacterium]|nr:hypothetical protein [Bacillota bacterium]
MPTRRRLRIKHLDGLSVDTVVWIVIPEQRKDIGITIDFNVRKHPLNGPEDDHPNPVTLRPI